MEGMCIFSYLGGRKRGCKRGATVSLYQNGGCDENRDHNVHTKYSIEGSKRLPFTYIFRKYFHGIVRNSFQFFHIDCSSIRIRVAFFLPKMTLFLLIPVLLLQSAYPFNDSLCNRLARNKKQYTACK